MDNKFNYKYIKNIIIYFGDFNEIVKMAEIIRIYYDKE